MKQFIISLLICSAISQFGQDDENYYNEYQIDETTTNDETSTSSSSNLQTYVSEKDAQLCVDQHCNEDIVACEHNENCFSNYQRYLICYNETQSYTDCKTPLLNSTIITQSFEFTDIMECYNLCGWSETKGKFTVLIQMSILLFFYF